VFEFEIRFHCLPAIEFADTPDRRFGPARPRT